jgi:hypothetical protein
MEIKTPSEIKKELRERLEAVKSTLPPHWQSTFLHLFPEYAENREHLYNVGKGLSLDEAVISKMEELSKKINS